MANTRSNNKPTVAIIGPGRLGTAMAIALSRRRYKISALVGRRRPGIKKATHFLDAPVETLVIKEIEKLALPELVIISTPDDEISKVVKALRTMKPQGRSTVLHTSGALSSAILSELETQNWSTGSIHPLVSVSEPVEGAAALENAFWCIEGDSSATRLSRRLVRDLKGQSFSVSAESKPLYHAAAVMSAGNVVAVFDVAVEMLARCGLSQAQARRVLLPLLSSTAANLAQYSPARALTGTFSRGDVATMKLHLEALSRVDLKDALDLYRLLGQRSLELARQNGLGVEIVKKMEAVLGDRPRSK